MPIKFVNEKRRVGATVEGFGEHRVEWPDYEIKCPCGKWTQDYGDVSQQVANDPDEHQWLCPRCVRRSEEHENERHIDQCEKSSPRTADDE